MTPRVGRKDRAGQLQRGGQVRVVGVGPALELGELSVGADVDLDLRIAAEAQHAGSVFALALGHDLAHERGLPVDRALCAGG